METCICPDCKAVVPDIEGATHAYFGSNAGCWKLYGDILAREFNDQRYMKVHRLTVDAYAAQHPGENEPRAAQSVNIHLVALYLVLELQMPFTFATKALGDLVKRKNHKFAWLNPPNSLGEITVVDLLPAKTPEEHSQLARAWAQSVWQAWKPHHKEIEILAQEII